jgi:hypothetical protein
MGYTAIDREDPGIEVFRGVFRKMRRALGATGFGVNEIAFPAGASGPEHDEADLDEEEVYVALEGSGTIVIDGEELPFAGTWVRVDPGSRRQVTAGPGGLRMLAIGGKQGSHQGRPTL